MTRKLVPIKNMIIENERTYLNEALQSGLKLQKRGFLFYHFIETSSRNGTYGIDLIAKDSGCFTLDNWELVTMHKIFYRQMRKVYYLSTDPAARLLADEATIFRYYTNYGKICGNLSGILISLLIVAIPFMFTLLPSHLAFLGYTMIVLLPLITLMGIQSTLCHKTVNPQYVDDDWLPAHYILNVKIPTKNLSEYLTAFGYVRKVDDNFYRIQSNLFKEELVEEILSATGLERKEIELLNLGDLYMR